ncbi:hypothetical protein LJC08_01950 [Methanimicrococcus sp. OttesenSCG-928-J09]|nr:hypothetical protein [Methanimicrococcus sp. OttesenSCG-928-J09]
MYLTDSVYHCYLTDSVYHVTLQIPFTIVTLQIPFVIAACRLHLQSPVRTRESLQFLEKKTKKYPTTLQKQKNTQSLL